MDATRARRLKDAARQRWYAACRCRRLARHLGFAGRAEDASGPEVGRRPQHLFREGVDQCVEGAGPEATDEGLDLKNVFQRDGRSTCR